MKSLEVSGAVRPIYGSLGVKRLEYFEAVPKLFIVYSYNARIYPNDESVSGSEWSRGPRRSRLLRLWIRIPPGA